MGEKIYTNTVIASFSFLIGIGIALFIFDPDLSSISQIAKPEETDNTKPSLPEVTYSVHNGRDPIETVSHDGHRFVLFRTGIIHSPACPCGNPYK